MVYQSPAPLFLPKGHYWLISQFLGVISTMLRSPLVTEQLQPECEFLSSQPATGWSPVACWKSPLNFITRGYSLTIKTFNFCFLFGSFSLKPQFWVSFPWKPPFLQGIFSFEAAFWDGFPIFTSPCFLSFRHVHSSHVFLPEGPSPPTWRGADPLPRPCDLHPGQRQHHHRFHLQGRPRGPGNPGWNLVSLEPGNTSEKNTSVDNFETQHSIIYWKAEVWVWE